MEPLFTRPALQPNVSRTVSLEGKQRLGSGTTQGKKQKQKNPGRQMIMYRHLSAMNKIRRLLRATGTVSTSAGGIVLIGTPSTSNVTGCPDWGNISVEFQQYRVRRLIVKFIPVLFTVNPTNSLAIACCRWWGLAPVGITTMSAEPSFFLCSSQEEFEIENNFLGFPDGELWTDTNASISAAFSYGVAYMSLTSPTTSATSVVFAYEQTFEVDFMGTY